MIDAGIGANSASATGYNIDNSVKLEADNSEYFSKTPSSNSNRQNFTFSTWVKRTELGQNARLIDAHQDGQNFFTFGFDTSDRLVIYNIDSGVDYGGHYTQRFRDTSAWYHIVFRSETTSGTATTRWKIYVNGVEITAKDTDYGTPPRWYQSNLNSTISHKVGYNTDGSNGSSQYMAETHLVDGTPLLPTSFGEFDDDSGIWKPIKVDVTYGTNGFYLDYTDGSDLGNDANASNNFAENNLTAADQSTDTPTNNFATGNPLAFFSNPTTSTFNPITEGATQFKKGAGGWETMTSSIAVTSGKWYCELQNISVPESVMMAILPVDAELIFRGGRVSYHPGASSGDGGVAQYGYNGTLYVEGVGTTYSPSPSWANGTDVMGIALDMDNGKVYFAKGNTWMNNGDPTTGSTGTGAVNIPDYTTKPYVFGYSLYANNSYGRMNFGGYTSGSISSAESDADGYGNFEYAPPTGYYALCTKNLAEYG